MQTHRKKDNQASLTNYCSTRAVSNRDPGSLVVSISNFPKAEGASAHTKNNPGPHAVTVTFLLKSRLQLTRTEFGAFFCDQCNVIQHRVHRAPPSTAYIRFRGFVLEHNLDTTYTTHWHWRWFAICVRPIGAASVSESLWCSLSDDKSFLPYASGTGTPPPQ